MARTKRFRECSYKTDANAQSIRENPTFFPFKDSEIEGNKITESNSDSDEIVNITDNPSPSQQSIF